jgi:hypothetical protein
MGVTKMTNCECLEGCPFFNGRMPIESALGKLYKERYCLGKFMDCARHQVKTAVGKEKVPTNLYPNMFDKAKKIILETA